MGSTDVTSGFHILWGVGVVYRALLFCPFTAVSGITSSDILGHIARESWPPVVACDELQGFPTAWMACCWCIMVESEDVGMEVLVLWDIDPLQTGNKH